MTTHSLLLKTLSAATGLALVLALFGAALVSSVQEARAATMAEQIICYVDQQLGPDLPFDPNIDYCGDGEPTEPGPIPQCIDNIDNDNDGVKDLADPDCDSATDTTESGSMGTSTGTTTPMQCADSVDNDNDGVTDLADPDCDSVSDNTESGTMGTSTGTTTPTQCEDTLDNDTDGVIDLADPDCSNADDNTESGSMGTSTGTTTDAALHVDSIEAVKTTAVANDTYADGWRYVFHITTPNDEENLSMRFSDWFASSSSSTIPVANNMRVSSAQASSTGTITLTAANAYSTPPMIMTSDLNPSMPGRQVDVLVEVKVPVGTANQTYYTNYGVQTLP